MEEISWKLILLLTLASKDKKLKNIQTSRKKAKRKVDTRLHQPPGVTITIRMLTMYYPSNFFVMNTCLGRPLLCYKDVIKRDLRSAQIDTAHGRTSPNTNTPVGKVPKRGYPRRKRTLESRLHARERRGNNAQPLRAIQQRTSAPSAK